MERPHALGLSGCSCPPAGTTGSASGAVLTTGSMGSITEIQGRRGVRDLLIALKNEQLSVLVYRTHQSEFISTFSNYLLRNL